MAKLGPKGVRLLMKNCRSFVGRGESRLPLPLHTSKGKRLLSSGVLGGLFSTNYSMIFRTAKGGRLAHRLFPLQKQLASREQWCGASFSKAYIGQLEQHFSELKRQIGGSDSSLMASGCSPASSFVDTRHSWDFPSEEKDSSKTCNGNLIAPAC